MKSNKITFLPVSNGDGILLTLDGYNILIDGGFSNTYKILKQYLSTSQIKTIDLAILTHSDSDHIGGLISLIKDSNFHIKNLWFNSYDKLSQMFNSGYKDSTKDISVSNESNEISFAKAKKLSELLDEQKKDYESIYIDKFENSKYYMGELAFTFLSPSKSKLLNLYENWSIEDQKIARKESSALAKGKKTIEEYASFVGECKADNSVQNGSSIAFVLTYKENNYLFLADAHMDIVVDTLKSLGFNQQNKLYVDFIKLAHHGSNANICQDFLDIVETKKYIISTNGKSHNHPDIETLCFLIVDAKVKNKEIELIFNYPSHAYSNEKNILKKKFNKEHYGYDLIFADDIQKGYTFEV